MTAPLALAVVLLATGAGAVVDARTRRVPNPLSLALATAGVTLAATGAGRVGVIAALVGGLLGIILMLPGHVLGATGGGDVKLFGAAATVLGPAGTLWAFVFTLIAGGALALLVAARRGRLLRTLGRMSRLVRVRQIDIEEPDGLFAYAPAIAVGVTCAAVFV
jgi:prepilin peptidase CpaA